MDNLFDEKGDEGVACAHLDSNGLFKEMQWRIMRWGMLIKRQKELLSMACRWQRGRGHRRRGGDVGNVGGVEEEGCGGGFDGVEAEVKIEDEGVRD